MQALIARTCGGSVPDNDVVGAVSRRNPRRTSTVLTLAPSKHDRGGICWSNFVGPNRARIVMKTKICSLAGAVGDSRDPSVCTGNIRLRH